MLKLHDLKNTTREDRKRKRLGRGIGSGKGKTCGRGMKGQGARSGARRRWGKEGGAMPLFMKTPIRGFSNVRFAKRYAIINLDQISELYSDGEAVTRASLEQKGFLSGDVYGIKVLGNGELTKKVTLEIDALSDGAKKKLQEAGATFTLLASSQERE